MHLLSILVLCVLPWTLALAASRDGGAQGFVRARRSISYEDPASARLVKRMTPEAIAAAATHLDTLARKYEFFANQGTTLGPDHIKDFKELQEAASHMHRAAGGGEAGLRDMPSSSYGTGYLPVIPHSSGYRSLSPEEQEKLTESVRADVHQRLATEVQPVFDYHASKLAETEDELQRIRQAQDQLQSAQQAARNGAWYKNRGAALGAAALAGIAISDTASQAFNSHRDSKMNQRIVNQEAEIAALKAAAAKTADAHPVPAGPKSGAMSPPAVGTEAPSTESGATAATAPQPKTQS